MEEKTISYIVISILVLILFSCVSIIDNLIYLRKDIENKISGKCIYINEKYYCES